MKKPSVYIVHGYMASSTDHWFPWLKEKLAIDDIEATILDLPQSAQPDRTRWLRYMKEHVHLNENSIMVAHSLGCLATFNLLEVTRKNIDGLLLISGFVNSSPLPELDKFVSTTTDTALIKQLTAKRIAIAAKDDRIVPYHMTVDLADKLDSDLITLETGNHLMASDGFFTFPLILDILKAWYTKKEC